MDKTKAKAIQDAIVALVASHPEWEVTIAKNNAAYEADELRLSLTLKTTNEDALRAAFAADAEFYGVKPEAYGVDIPGAGKLIGFDNGRRKGLARVKRAEGGVALCRVSDLLARLPEGLCAS